MAELGQNLFTGLVASGSYLLLALGITLVFGLTRLINFAHGEFLVFGALIAYSLTSHGYSFWLAILASTVLVGAGSLLLQRGLFRWTLDNPLSGMVVGLGVLLVIEILALRVWGYDIVSVRAPFDGGWTLAGVSLSFNRITALAIAAAFTVALFVIIQRTRVGRQMAAAQEDPLAASLVGVDVGRVIALAFVVGSAAAGAAGATLGTMYPIGPFDGGPFILKGFAVALLGGLGNVRGAVVASFIYGVGEALIGGYWDPSWVPVFTYGIVILILLVRPGGLMGTLISDSPLGQFGERSVTTTSRGIPIPPGVRAVLVIAVPTAIAVAFELMPSSRLQAVLTLAAIYVVMCYSLSLLYNVAGMLSVAQGGFMAIGAYTSAIVAIHFGWGFWASLLPAFLLSAMAGAALGLPVARAKGHYFVLLTFAFGSLIVLFIQNLKDLTRGDQGLIVTSNPSPIGPISFGSLGSMFYLAFSFAIAAAAATAIIQRSPLGLRLAAIRDSEGLARSLGLNVALYKVIAFGIAGGMAGVAGVLFLYQQRAIVPDSFGVLASIVFVVMVLLGGRSILGPPVGVLVLLLIPEMLQLDPANKQVVFGAVLVAITLFLPRGIIPSIRDAVDRIARRQAPQPFRISDAPSAE